MIKECPYCNRNIENKNICLCGAYRVTEESHDLPLKEQPYFNPDETPKKIRKNRNPYIV